ncbi:phosphotransferase family protein [Sciscionella marina]|uniref:phosphotransferase family protein n=1 Tax=Sciscionella marina TaxID=508770 RepID=UPI00036F0328|nr:phosphotransferase family protein [Sciscionella marina]
MDARIDAALDVLIDSGELPLAARSRNWKVIQLAGGWSRRTHLVSDDTISYVVRAKPDGSLLDTDLEREYRTYVALQRAKIPVPATYGINTAQQTAFDGPFFVMDWVRGNAPNTWQRTDRELLEANWANSRSLGTDLVETAVQIHQCPVTQFTHLGAARAFHEVVDRWQDTFERQRLVRDPIIDESFEWVRSREPDPVPPALVHGDYRIGNAMLDNHRIAAMMDWELAYIGDPRFDLGYANLDYFAGKFVHKGSDLLCAVADRDWFFTEYAQRTGAPVDRDVVRTYTALGALALLTILHTGIRMYADGKTPDIRMAWNQYAMPGLRHELTTIMTW